ncbi:MAG: hypothetical protein L3J25_05560, partial [Flavobacteriaceae bacterium]|nr:hypothetical protein [Flavobacteriaceae bacterium]
VSGGGETIAKIEATTDTKAGRLDLIGNQTGQDGAIGKIIGFNNADSLGYMYFLREDADSSGEISFGTQNAGTIGERVRIDKAGNVGIGTTAPGAKLQINPGYSSVGLSVNDPSNRRLEIKILLILCSFQCQFGAHMQAMFYHNPIHRQPKYKFCFLQLDYFLIQK